MCVERYSVCEFMKIQQKQSHHHILLNDEDDEEEEGKTYNDDGSE
jgi:hypothetical protein